MVNKIIVKPHLFFFLLVPVFILIAFLNGDKMLDINIYDFYFVISNDHLYLFFAVFYAMMGVNYFALFWAEKPSKKGFTILHISLQIIALLFLFTKNNWNWIGKQYPKQLLLLNDNSSTVILISFLIFLLSVFVHLINFFASLFLKTTH